MSTATSLPPNAPVTNGTSASGHGEADVSSDGPSSFSLERVCADLHEQVCAFLASAATDDVTRRTQEQTRIALGVIEKALEDYQ